MTVCTNAFPISGSLVTDRGLSGVAARLRFPCCRPTNRQPPPSGMLPNFVTSTWIIAPGASCSYRLIGSSVIRSMWESRLMRHRTRTADLHRPEAPPAPRFHDLFHQFRRRLRRHPVRAAGSISPPRSTICPIPGSPLPGRDRRHHEQLRRRGRGPSALDDQPCESKTGARGQRSVSVGHEGLLVGEAVPRQLHSTTGRPSSISASPTAQRHNVPGHHS